MNLFQSIKNTLFQQDYVALTYTNNQFIVKPVKWFGGEPSIELGDDRQGNPTYVRLPKSGNFEAVSTHRYDDVQYPNGYKTWSPITPKITKYYQPQVATADSKSDSGKNTRSSTVDYTVTR